MEGMAKIIVLFVVILNNCFLIRSDCESGDCDPTDPNSQPLSIRQLCQLVPDRGTGIRDIIRVYYNPILQNCLPFSWSGFGGNANRFVSIKNCYEICHPSDPGIGKLTDNDLHPYLLKRDPPKYYRDPREGIPQLFIPPIVDNWPKEQINQEKNGRHVVRQIKHPLDPSKTLTIVQPVSYLVDEPKLPKVTRVLMDKHKLLEPNQITQPQPEPEPQSQPEPQLEPEPEPQSNR